MALVTSHGKGVVDGTGGAIKQEVWTICKAGQHAVSSAEASASTTQDRHHGIKIFYISTLHHAVMNQVCNRTVQPAETNSAHAVMPIAAFVTEYQYYSFSVKKTCAYTSKENLQSPSSHKHKN
jgi:hypothetical protein